MNLDKSSASDRLSFTVFLAIAVHAFIILGIGFGISQEQEVAPTLNITLATHRSENAPEQADYLAQYNQEASGTIDEARELTAREYAEVAAPNINQITPLPKQKSSEQSQNSDTRITTDDSTFTVSRQEQDDELDEKESVAADDEDTPLLNPEIASLRAKLDRQKQELTKRPRIRRMTSVATRSSADAQYLNKWTQKVEMVGNRHFPQAALEQGLSGTLRLSVIVNHDGTVEAVEILKPSGFPVLDQAALQTIRLASPFDPFPAEIRKTADQLDIIRTWNFEITGLTTGNSTD